MDPVGFALENFDAIGRWRTYEDGVPVDASGGLPDGSKFVGVDALEQGLLKRPELFVGTFAEKLLTFALGRGIETFDAPAIRKIVTASRADDFRISSVYPRRRQQRAVSNEKVFPMIITKKALPRRTFLKTVGATMALPLLDAMIPAATALNQNRRQDRFAASVSFSCRWAATSRAGRPRSEKTLDELSPILRSLAPVREHVTALTNMELANAYPGSHATSNSSFLSAAKAKHTEGNDYYLGTTVDQVAAQQLGRDTQLPSLELSMDLMQTVGQCDNGYACVYQNNLSWSTPTTPLPAEAHPRIVFETLFGEGGTSAERRAALRKRASLLDAFNQRHCSS